jgi:hypothetical protein
MWFKNITRINIVGYWVRHFQIHFYSYRLIPFFLNIYSKNVYYNIHYLKPV